LQLGLLGEPQKGDPIPGCSILRKIRFGDVGRSRGTRGGLRIVYLYTPAAARIDLLTVYSKNEAADLTASQTRELCQLARLLRDEASKAMSAVPRDSEPPYRRLS
jgi:hypothetical protein